MKNSIFFSSISQSNRERFFSLPSEWVYFYLTVVQYSHSLWTDHLWIEIGLHLLEHLWTTTNCNEAKRIRNKLQQKMKFHVQLCVQQPGNTTLSIQNVYVHLFLKAIVVEPEIIRRAPYWAHTFFTLNLIECVYFLSKMNSKPVK